MSTNWSPVGTYLLKPNGMICPYRKEVKEVQGQIKVCLELSSELFLL